ncbi:protein TMEPAI-like isoform X2 [Limulus polyphemus]|uniref:Protein TMEPAI-like isoform X2 n=1 Tax=Limulus polyphemus TaxID=6850 RepID=A0ABM1SV93_LIMPO|nr:protein TMEPAI-like isoform X2 [Limulus polyphemus]
MPQAWSLTNKVFELLSNFFRSYLSFGSLYHMTVSALQIVIIVIAVVLMLGFITCILSHYKMGAWSWQEGWGRPPLSPLEPQSFLQGRSPQNMSPVEHNYTPASHSSVLYTPDSLEKHRKMDLASKQDQQIRQQTVQMDFTLGLPATISLPDGEKFPHIGSKSVHVQDSIQDNEILRSWIKPPPNKTVSKNENPPPYQPNSFCLLSKPVVLQTPNISSLVVHSNSGHLNVNADIPSNHCNYLQESCNVMLLSHIEISNIVSTRDTSGSGQDDRSISEREQSVLNAVDSPPFYCDFTDNQDHFTDSTNGV